MNSFKRYSCEKNDAQSLDCNRLLKCKVFLKILVFGLQLLKFKFVLETPFINVRNTNLNFTKSN